MAVRRRPRTKFYFVLGATAVVIAVILVLLLGSPHTVAVEWSSAEFDNSYDMLIVRDEVVYEAKNYGKTNYIAVEGQSVNVGDPIVEVYEWGYNDETLSKLLELQKTIMQYQTEVVRTGVIDETLNDINSRIDAKATQIQQAIFDNNSSVLLSLERDMEALLDERMAYLRENTMPDEQLGDYYTQESELLTRFAKWRSELNANESGIVSFYFDGCEALMNKQNIGSFTREALEEVLEGKTVEIPQKDKAYAPLYRVSNGNEWYVVLLSDKKIPEMHLGNSFSIIFEDYLDTQYTGLVYDVSELDQNAGYVYTIIIQDNIGPLLGERRVSARLYGMQESLSIPKSCVKTVDKVDYVETAEGEYVPVLVIADKGDTVLVQTYEGEATLEIGQLIRR
jgi:hypothetical protein